MFPIPNTFGVRAQARHQRVVESPCTLPQRHFVVGQGSNLLPLTDFEGTLVQIAGLDRRWWRDGETVVVEADGGVIWHELVAELVAAGIGGLENLALIPGTVGAAPVQNIGAYGLEVGERIACVEGFDAVSGEPFCWDAAACGFGYRLSVFKTPAAASKVITRVRFALPVHWQPSVDYTPLRTLLAGPALTPMRVFEAVCAVRSSKLPDWQQLGNAGSFFKNPVVDEETATRLQLAHPDLVSFAAPDGRKLAAGWLIDRCGLKGLAIGGAAVHTEQALVLVNRGGATATDVVRLAQQVRQTVASQFGVWLEPEVRFLASHGEVDFDEACNCCAV